MMIMFSACRYAFDPVKKEAVYDAKDAKKPMILAANVVRYGTCRHPVLLPAASTVVAPLCNQARA